MLRPPGLYRGDLGCVLRGIVLILVLTGVGVVSYALAAPEQSPVVTAAHRALSSSKPLRPWERAWYTKVVNGTVQPRKVRVWQTQYGPYEGFDGDYYHIAANPKYLPKGTVVYMPSTGRLMVVTNRGASSNDRIAQNSRNRCAFWVDRWERTAGTYTTGPGDIYIIGKAPWHH